MNTLWSISLPDICGIQSLITSISTPVLSLERGLPNTLCLKYIISSLDTPSAIPPPLFCYTFLESFLVAQMIKNLPAMLEAWVPSLGQEDLLEKGMATHSSTLAWRIPWTEEPGRLQSMGSQRVGHHWVTNTFTFFVVFFSYHFIIVYEFMDVVHCSRSSFTESAAPSSCSLLMPTACQGTTTREACSEYLLNKWLIWNRAEISSKNICL